MIPVQHEARLSSLSTLGIGGPGAALARIHHPSEIEAAVDHAADRGWPVLYLGAGSNVLFSDDGFRGMILKNEIPGIEIFGSEVEAGAGEDLGGLIRRLNREGLGGLERLYGIPGTVAGAVVGNAGAYGQEIGDSLIEAEIRDGKEIRTLPASELGFRYRHSRFKDRRAWFLTRCRFKLRPRQGDLQKVSDEILQRRLVKYPPGLKCPGSFFKNIPLDDVPADTLAALPANFVVHGKIPAGKLLEAVGARGSRLGGALIANYHGNLVINDEGARSREIVELAGRYSGKVLERFGIQLEAEILVVGQDSPANLMPDDH